MNVWRVIRGGSWNSFPAWVRAASRKEDPGKRAFGSEHPGALFWKLLNPVNWVRLASPYFSRIDLAAEYDAAIFERQTFSALAEGSPRPSSFSTRPTW